MNRRCSPLIATVAVSCIVGFYAVVVEAEQRTRIHFDETDGLRQAQSEWICQDTTGFVWIGSFAGLSRYDGNRMADWAPEVLGGGGQPICGPNDQLLVIENGRRQLFQLLAGEREHAVPLVDELGRAIVDVEAAVVGIHGTIWYTRDGHLHAVAMNGARRTWHHDSSFDRDHAKRLWAAQDGGVLVGTGRSVRRVEFGGSVSVVATVETDVYEILETEDGGLWVGTIGFVEKAQWSIKPALFRVSGGRVQRVASADHLVRGLASHGVDVYAAAGPHLWHVSSGLRLSEIASASNGIDGFTDVEVDHEGGLWVAAFRGVDHYPEPEVLTWNASSGLPAHPRFLSRAAGTVFVSTWFGLGALTDSAHGVEPSKLDAGIRDPLCLGSEDVLWGVEQSPGSIGIVSLHTGQLHHRFALDVADYSDCATSDDGTVWLIAGGQLFRGAADGASLESVGSLPSTVTRVRAAITERADGTLVVAADRRMCRVEVHDRGVKGLDAWTCEDVPDAPGVTDLLEVNGTLIVGTTGRGAMHRDREGRWRSTTQVEPACGAVHRLEPSPRGGFWIAGPGCTTRFGASETGFEVLETMTSARGAPQRGTADILEQPDGTLWLAAIGGVSRIPRVVRDDEPTTPRVLTLASTLPVAPLDGRFWPTLRHDEASVTMTFAALSYRAPGELRFRMRTRSDGPWVEGVERTVHLSSLRPGDYAVEFEASIDGRRWGGLPRPIYFEVLSPWYLRPWALAVFGAALLGLAFLAHRIRTTRMLALVEQRRAIARDLHDEFGSGLGSIGLTAELLDGPSAAVIRRTATELGYALTDIVSALGTDAENLGAFLNYLTDRGQRLFPSDTTFVTDFPDPVPSQRLPVKTRAHLQRIMLEAFHNAAKHGRAKRVVFSVCIDGRYARFAVTDDGCGFEHDSFDEILEPGHGAGFANMQSRAREIGGQLEIRAAPGVGTVVEVRVEIAPRVRFWG